MSKQEFEQKLDFINRIILNDSFNISIPVPLMLQEAEDLYQWCKDDMEVLIKSGLDGKLVEDLPMRAGALRYAQSVWSKDYKNFQDCQLEWKEQSPAAYNLRDELLHNFFHAYFNMPGTYAKVQRIAEGSSHADMIQDLIDLAVLGEEYKDQLAKIGMNMNMLDEAKELSEKMAELLAKVNGVRAEISPLRELRDKSYIYLKESMDEIRRHGQFVFWRNSNKSSGYASKYHKKKNQKTQVAEQSS